MFYYMFFSYKTPHTGSCESGKRKLESDHSYMVPRGLIMLVLVSALRIYVQYMFHFSAVIKEILYSYLIFKKMNERITES